MRTPSLYLHGQAVTVLTADNLPLLGMINKPGAKLSARVERWVLRLQPYDVTLKYQKGADNPADYMSRHPDKSATIHLEISANMVYLEIYPNELEISAIHLEISTNTVYLQISPIELGISPIHLKYLQIGRFADIYNSIRDIYNSAAKVALVNNK